MMVEKLDRDKQDFYYTAVGDSKMMAQVLYDFQEKINEVVEIINNKNNSNKFETYPAHQKETKMTIEWVVGDLYEDRGGIIYKLISKIDDSVLEGESYPGRLIFLEKGSDDISICGSNGQRAFSYQGGVDIVKKHIPKIAKRKQAEYLLLRIEYYKFMQRTNDPAACLNHYALETERLTRQLMDLIED